MRAAPALVIAIAAAAAPSLSRASNATAEARALYARGQERYQAGDHASAAALFLRAHERQARPELLFDAAQALRLAGNCERAAILYRDFLLAAPNNPNRAVVEDHIAAMDRCVAGRVARNDGSSTRATAGWALGSAGVALVSTAGLLWSGTASSDRSGRLAWVTGFAGAGALIAGAALLVTSDREDESSPRLTLADGGAVVGWSWGF